MNKFVLMGVAGCGKTSIGDALAPRIDATFIDGDALHPQSNIDKMASGQPLGDDDRWPWLELVGAALADSRGTTIIGCSALKRRYRDAIRKAAGDAVCFVHLSGSRELIQGRMSARKGHFMPPSLLDSQFAALERPETDETALTVDISGTEAEIVEQIVKHMETMTS